jgi:hypothetical protein
MRVTSGPNYLEYGEQPGANFKDQSGIAEQRGQDQAQAALNQIAQAAQALGGVKETFSAITKSLEIITANLDANKTAAAAEKAAGALSPDGTFSAAVGNFDKAVDKLLGGVGLTPAKKAAADNARPMRTGDIKMSAVSAKDK